jgi:sigma-B regulation protein RsbU (phosphoserine phosphatase)
VALVALLLFAACGIGARAVGLLLDIARGSGAAAPFELDVDRVRRPSPAAEQAGLRAGDRLVAVDGRPFVGQRVLALALRQRSPGATLPVSVVRADGARAELVLPTPSASVSGSVDLALALLLIVALPLFCSALGFWVVARRRDDPLAWLLLGLLLSFSMLFVGGPDPQVWPAPLRWPALAFRGLFTRLWPVFMLLFGVYFPERAALDRRWPWLKLLMLVPQVVMALGRALVEPLVCDNMALARPMVEALRPLAPTVMPLSLASVGAFFALLGYKSGTLPSADARRRLRLLWTGTGVGLAPLLGLVIVALRSGTAIGQGLPNWITAPALAAMALFPLTLAYTIVVERALDVGVVLRQGLQYALARNGILVLRVAISMAVIALAASLAGDPSANRPRRLMFISAGVMSVFLVQRAAERLRAFLDRRFFREALDTERLLHELADDVRTLVDTDVLLDTTCRRLADALHVPRVAALLARDGDLRTARAVGLGEPPPDVSLPEDGGLAARLRTEERPLVVYTADARSWTHTLPERAGLEALHAQALVPLRQKERLAGLLTLGPKLSEEAYAPSDLRLLQAVAAQVALALENARLTATVAAEVARRERLNRELEIAREVQEQLLPQQLPRVEALDLAGRCRPARGVGGDYYDFLSLPGGRLGLAIGDVSGKGIPAALLMASLQASLRGQATFGTRDLAELMARVNQLLCASSSPNRYATFFYGEYDAGSGRLAYVNAGHNAPLLLRADGSVERLDAGGPVVGLIEFAGYASAEVELRRGDRLLGFTDGLSEAMNPQDEEWGEERLTAAFRACDGLAADATLERMMAAADAFAAGAPQHDDMTALVVRVVA